MSATQKSLNLGAVALPFAGFLASIYLLWNSYVTTTDVVILVCCYVATSFGITLGFHRLGAHRAFDTYRPIRYALAVLGSLAVEGPVLAWVADHRKHHSFSDREGDPHSPHVGRGSGFAAAVAGLWHAHVGWLFWGQRADPRRYARDLLDDRGMVLISRLFGPLTVVSLAIPLGIGYAVGGTLGAALQALFWGGVIRIFLLHHVTWSINSVCHFVGRRRFATNDESRNVWWLALASVGEAWHNNHHAFPRSAYHGLRAWEIDVAGLLISVLERLGLVWNVVRIPRERQARRERALAAKLAGS
jgi:stearoyl-CoA desaturase (delta-9 desaturase)